MSVVCSDQGTSLMGIGLAVSLLRTREADEISCCAVSIKMAWASSTEIAMNTMPAVDIQAKFVGRRFSTNACPALITRAEWNRFRPRISHSEGRV